VDGYLVYTNKQMGGALRGFGMAQATFAVEAQLDAAAKGAGHRPPGDPPQECLSGRDSLAVGRTEGGCHQALPGRGGPGRPLYPGKIIGTFRQLGRGRGIGALIYTTSILNYPNPSAGGGGRQYGWKPHRRDGIDRSWPGLEDGPRPDGRGNPGGFLGQNQRNRRRHAHHPLRQYYRFQPGDLRYRNAVVRAAQDARDNWRISPPNCWRRTRGPALCGGQGFVQGASQKFKTLADLARYLFQKKGEIVMGKGLFAPPQVRMDEETGAGEPTPCYTYGAAIAEVEVDRETGLLRIVDLVACYDCGRAINPLLTEGQIDGGLLHGIGFTLMEDMYPPLSVSRPVGLRPGQLSGAYGQGPPREGPVDHL